MVNLRFNLPLPVIRADLFQLYWMPVRLVWQTHYALMNAMTLGMLDELQEEVEHALVEGSDVVKMLTGRIQQIQQQPLTLEQRQVLAKTSLNDAGDDLQTIVKELVNNLLQLPFNRLVDRPVRKRFPVTIEGHIVDK